MVNEGIRTHVAQDGQPNMEHAVRKALAELLDHGFESKECLTWRAVASLDVS